MSFAVMTHKKCLSTLLHGTAKTYPTNIHQLTVCVQLPTSADMALPVFAADSMHQSINISWPLGPQQQTHSRGVQWPDGTDVRTPDSCTDPDPHSMQVVPKSQWIPNFLLYTHRFTTWQNVIPPFLYCHIQNTCSKNMGWHTLYYLYMCHIDCFFYVFMSSMGLDISRVKPGNVQGIPHGWEGCHMHWPIHRLQHVIVRWNLFYVLSTSFPTCREK